MIPDAPRKIVEIDESKCDGCGLCVPSCADGAIRIVNGKARLVSDVYCDGLGACLGHCPQDAIRIVERPAGAFDREAARKQAIPNRDAAAEPARAQPDTGQPRSSLPGLVHGGCPGAAVRDLRSPASPLPPHGLVPRMSDGNETAPSRLANWPVQWHLVPPGAPYLKDADLLLVADCVPFACADFHSRFLDGRPVMIGCPKLDDSRAYVEKLTRILSEASVRSVTVVFMEVPCCTGLVRIAQAAIAQAGRPIPLHGVTVSIRGHVVDSSSLPRAGERRPDFQVLACPTRPLPSSLLGRDAEHG